MNLISIYSVPFWQSDYPEFEEYREKFLTIAKEYKEQNPPKNHPKSSVAGYQSPNTLQNVEEFRPLFEYICQMAFKASADLDFIDCNVAITSAWLNVNDSRQCMNGEHVHSDVFSGVFYLKAPEGSGKLVLQNPAINKMWDGCNFTAQKNQFTAESIHIEPVEGSIIFFPSYISHSVETNDHDEERISISFNVITFPKDSVNI